MNTFTLRCAGRAGILVTAIVCSPLAMAVGKAGLWEATTTMNMGGAMPQMSPEQLEKMKEMGMKMPMMSPTTVVKYCVTPEMAAKDTPPNEAEKQGCKMTNMKKSGSGMSADMVCDGEFKGTGHIDASYSGDSSYTTRISMKGTSARSPMPMDMTMNSSGKWLGADCGSVKPAGTR